MEFITFRLTPTQLTEIHSSVKKGMNHLTITRVDIVVGLLERCLPEVEPESTPIDTISYMVNVRVFRCLSYTVAYFFVAPRDGYMPGQCGAQRDRSTLHRTTGLERGRPSRRSIGLRHRNTQIVGESGGP